MAVPKQRVSYTKKRIRFAGSKRKNFVAHFLFCDVCKTFRNYRITDCSCVNQRNQRKHYNTTHINHQ